VGERDLLVGKEPNEIREEASGDDDLALALDLARHGRPQRDLHVGRGERQLSLLDLDEDPGEDLDGGPARETPSDDAGGDRELVTRDRHAKLCGSGEIGVHVYWKLEKGPHSRHRSVQDGEDGEFLLQKQGIRLSTVLWTSPRVSTAG